MPKGGHAGVFSGVPALCQLPSRMTDGHSVSLDNESSGFLPKGLGNMVTWQPNLLYSRTERLSSTNHQRIYSPYLTPTFLCIVFLSPKALCCSGQISSRCGCSPFHVYCSLSGSLCWLPRSSLLHSLETFQSSFTYVVHPLFSLPQIYNFLYSFTVIFNELSGRRGICECIRS